MVIDVRSPGEFAMGHVQGAVNLPLDRFAQEIEQLVPDRSAALVLYCASGARSGMACNVLQQLGYKNIVNGCNAGVVCQELKRPIHRI
jgi:phage shock protein E